MNEPTTSRSGGIADVLIEKNEHVQELFTILHENGKDTSGLSALINHLKGMEDFVSRAESKIVEMKAQLDTMKEVQNHPIKTSLNKTLKSFESKIAEIKAQISELKSNIINGCKNVVSAVKEQGAAVLNKLASFFRIKDGLRNIRDSTVKTAENCDKAVANINDFARQYHSAGSSIRNRGRIIAGKKPIDAVKEAGKLAKAAGAPYRAEKACVLGIQKQVDKMILSVENLEKIMESKPKKLTLTEQIEAKKKEISERESPKQEQKTKAQEMI
jgi:hypothetical protein